jgi:hypothetical protein
VKKRLTKKEIKMGYRARNVHVEIRVELQNREFCHPSCPFLRDLSNAGEVKSGCGLSVTPGVPELASEQLTCSECGVSHLAHRRTKCCMDHESTHS